MSHEMAPVSFAEVYAELQPKIRRYLSRMVGRTEAEDLAQEVFARVQPGPPGVPGRLEALHVGLPHRDERRV